MKLFRWEKKIPKDRIVKLEDEMYKLTDKVEEICKLLGVGFSADADYPTAHFIDKTKKGTGGCCL